MASDAPELVAIARAIAGGAPVDWTAADGHADDEAAYLLLRELKIIAAIAELHDADAVKPAAERWGPFHLLEHVGRGSFGNVYRALDTRLDREVALKLLRPADADGDRDTSVINEARLLARVRHRNVVTIHGADRFDGRAGLWMELLQGRTLEQRLNQDGPFSGTEVTHIGREICSALTAVHDAGLLHRDIKAQNVIQEPDGRIVLMDFGAGHDFGDGDVTGLAGSPLYLAPELLEGAHATVRSDIYGVGVLLYHLLTGSYPVVGRTLQDIRDAHRVGALMAPAATVAPALRRVLTRALQADPRERYSSATEMASALAARPRSHWPTAAAAACAVAALAGGWYVLRSGPPVSVEAEPQIIDAKYGDENGFVDRTGTMVFTDRRGADVNVLATLDSERRYRALLPSPQGEFFPFVPAMGSDGRVAISWRVSGARRQLQVVTPGSSDKPVVLVDEKDFDGLTPVGWSRDNAAVLALGRHRDGAQLVWVAISDASTQILATLGPNLRVEGRPSLSPDGEHIVYTAMDVSSEADAGSTQPRRRHIYVLGAHDRNAAPKEIAQDVGIDGAPVWIDPTHVLFVTSRESNADAFELRTATTDAPPGTPSRIINSKLRCGDMPCRWILHGLTSSGMLYLTRQVQAEQSKIVRMEAGGRRVASFSPVVRTIEGSLPSWAPDGRSIATKRERGLDKDGHWTGDTLINEVPSGSQSTFSLPGMTQTATRWLPKESGFLETTAHAGDHVLYRLSLNGEAPAKVLNYPSSVWTNTMALYSQTSADGRSLYVLGAEYPRELFEIDLTTGHRNRLATLPKPGWALKLSPDGRALAIMASDREGSYLYRFDFDGRRCVQVYALRDNAAIQIRPMLAWTNDSEEILFLQEDTSSMKLTPEFTRKVEEFRRFEKEKPPSSRRASMFARQSIKRVAAYARTPPEDVGINVEAGRVQEISVTSDGSLLAYGLRTELRELWSLDLSEPLRHLVR